MEQLSYIFFGTNFWLRPDINWTGTTNVLENFCTELLTILEPNGQYLWSYTSYKVKARREKIKENWANYNICKMFLTITLTNAMIEF